MSLHKSTNESTEMSPGTTSSLQTRSQPYLHMKSTCTSSTLSVALHAITAGDPSCAGVKTSLTEALPLELQINIFEFLDIKSLIKARSTCSLWRDPLLLSAVHPVRRRLLDMYMSLTGSGVFLASRQRHVEACKPFDRVAYLRVLQSQQPKGVPVPEAFEMWILEWPALAAFDCIWPGLPYEWCPDDVPFRRHGWNLLANNPPQLFRLTIWDETQRKYVALPGLPICEDYRSSPMYWLVTGKGHELYGRVIRIESRHPIQRRRADKYTGETQNNGDVLDVEKYGLPFLDWLQVALERYCLGLRDSIRSKVYFDTETRSWRPTLDDSHMLDKPMYCEGGDLVRFTVFRQFVGPQPKGVRFKRYRNCPPVPWGGKTWKAAASAYWSNIFGNSESVKRRRPQFSYAPRPQTALA